MVKERDNLMAGNYSLQSVWSFVRSKKLAAVMILILTLVSAAGMVIQQANIFQTPWFTAIGIIFLINLTACTVQQLINCFRMVGKKPVLDNGRNSFRVKGPWRLWGSGIFHIGLIIIVVGSLVSGSAKMAGQIKLAEGEERYELHHNYDSINEGPFFRERRHRGFGLRLSSQEVIPDENGNVDRIFSHLAILENGYVVRQETMSQKEPMVYRGIRIYQGQAGFAPLIEISGPGNKVLVSTYLLLESRKTGGKTEFGFDGFPVPGTPYSFDIKFYPDMVQQGAEISTEKYILSNPAAVITVTDGAEIIAREVVRSGGFMEFAGYRVKMGDIRHWNAFDLVNDLGANFVFAGLWVALAGLVIMYLPAYKKARQK